MPPRSAVPRNPIEPPSCPTCGCNACELIGAGMRWGRPWAKFACDHCGDEFGLGQRAREQQTGEAVYRVPFPKIKCPRCNSKNTKITSSPKAEKTQIKMRFHKCNDCDCDFSSFEED